MTDFFRPADSDDCSEICHPNRWISISRANALLKECGRVVYGRIDGDHGWTERNPMPTDGPYDKRTHTALLVNVQPIAKADSVDQIAKDLANYKFDHEVGHRFREFVERARRLLGEKAGKAHG